MKHRQLDDERGATLVIVALSLIALMGMIVLVVDVGGLLWKRREMINGADAAALAAAKTCADSADTSSEDAIALQYASDNVTDSGVVALGGGITDIEGCDSGPGFVTVEYTQDKKLFFAPVLGFANEGEVAGKATAAWGPIGGGDAVPIVIEAGALQGPCEIPDGAEKGDLCPLYYNNGNNALGAANWGYMNLSDRGWNVNSDANCVASGSADRRRWIINNYDGGARVLNGDPPGSDVTYVCADTGHSAANWQDLIDRMNKDPYLLFPVNNCDAQVDKFGNNVPCGQAPDKYAIVGFIRLKLVYVLKGNDQTTSDGTPYAIDGSPTVTSSGNCTTPLGLGAGGTRQLDVVAKGSCGAPSTMNSIPYTSVSVRAPSPQPINYTKCPPVGGTNCDYRYDETTFALTWVNPLTQADGRVKNVTLTWQVIAQAEPGICGARPSDPNAICLQMEYQGFTTSGGFVLGGEDFGTYGYVLCDRDLETCPDQQS
jgi:Putative Flp pilus-assembly TadE/G-like